MVRNARMTSITAVVAIAPARQKTGSARSPPTPARRVSAISLLITWSPASIAPVILRAPGADDSDKSQVRRRDAGNICGWSPAVGNRKCRFTRDLRAACNQHVDPERQQQYRDDPTKRHPRNA